jgi:hypothetical protein
MRLLRRRQPDPPAFVEAVPVVEQPAESVARKPKRRTAAERRNDAIEAEQLAAAEREKELAQIRQAARQAWEANRPREPFYDYGRFIY